MSMIKVVKHSMNQTWGFELQDIDLVQARIIKNILTNQRMDSLDYKMKSKCNPFLQGYTYDREGQWLYVEFWSNDLDSIHAFCEYVEKKITDPEEYLFTEEIIRSLNR